MQTDIDISVVIGFRNWGERRLQLAVKSIINSFGPLKGEVIVSDYGSDDGQVTKEGIEVTGARYVYTETDGSWSRSRALNAGFSHARGKILVSTDADMVFSPRSFEIIGRTLLENPSLCILLQCRDLPSTWSDKEVYEAGFDWETFESVSRLRPRWGMGGMMAVSREVFTKIRGLDERMHTYGGEDIDFATRAKRAGQRLLWIDDAEVRMYHMWHQPTRAQIEVTADAREAIQFNKDIVYSDKTFIRNTHLWEHRLQSAPPLVSVAIATHNRAEYLTQSILSVLGQTMQDFEIVVVDDGSTDETKSIVESFSDPRIRYFYQEQRGVASARNLAARESRGTYTAVHDDDDLMTPWRLQAQLDVIEAGIHGTFGAFVNFDDETGQMHLFRTKALNPGTIDETGGAPGHGTWMVETDIIRSLGYDESLTSGVDNNLALRMVRSGFKFVHCGEILMLRRLHPGQITVTDEHTQKLAARQTRQMFSFETSAWGKNKMKEERGANDWTEIRHAEQLNVLLPYLPDHLVARKFISPKILKNNLGPEFPTIWRNNELLGSLAPAHELSYAELMSLTKSGHVDEFEAVLRNDLTSAFYDNSDDSEQLIQNYLSENAQMLLEDSDNTCVAVIVRNISEKEYQSIVNSDKEIIKIKQGNRLNYCEFLNCYSAHEMLHLLLEDKRAVLAVNNKKLEYPILESTSNK
ncbi:glycosyltransferase [Glutamicibacter uratoxydans]|uniref:glycosyltransferase n=1 Tax=Glutamicibacter uratoxydans TaxID=43667 RepID=UPI003D6FCA03